MFRLPVSLALAPPPRPNAGGSSAPAPPRPPSRRGVVSSVAITAPLASHNSRTVPKLFVGTRYENGSTICVTVK
jgi:hypothetical protein